MCVVDLTRTSAIHRHTWDVDTHSHAHHLRPPHATGSHPAREVNQLTTGEPTAAESHAPGLPLLKMSPSVAADGVWAAVCAASAEICIAAPTQQNSARTTAHGTIVA